MIQLHRLEGFYWVAKTGGYARAARAFPYPITQPAVHQQVKKLEQDLDRALFERVAKDRMILTPAGRKLFDFVAPFFDQLDAALRAVRSDDDAGELSIHAEPLMLRHLLPRWLKRLQGRCPDARIELRELPEPDFGALRRGEADLLVGYLPDPPEDVATQLLANLRPYLVVPRDHQKAKRKRLSPQDLAEDPFVAYLDGTVAHDLQMKALRGYGTRPKRILFASSADTILGFVGSGLGYSLVPSLHAEHEFGADVASWPLPRLKAEFPVVAAWRLDAPENRLLDMALETAPKV